jgi:superfamily II DNA or RNA helicase/HKD family nuclease
VLLYDQRDMARRIGGPAITLPEGVYEHLVTEELARDLEAAIGIERDIEPLDEADAHATFARHVGRVMARVLSGVSAADAHELIGKVLDHVAGLVGDELAELIRDQRPKPPPSRLLALHRGAVPVRPTSPLATSTLLTRKRLDPTLGHELARELATADEVDAIIAFVTVGGVRVIHEALHDFARRPAPKLRLLTTTFTGTTDVAALDTFARLPGAQVRVSYDTRRTRLHAKAWLFRRNTGLTTAYIGSANLTSTALGAGQEWMVKVCAADLPHVIEQFEGTFDTLWSEPEFELYSPDDPVQRKRLQSALSAETSSSPDAFLVTLHALPFQEVILDKLTAERVVHGRRRNLVVAATGTGKTVIAALDYVRQFASTGVAPRLLFLAHRFELLDQARKTFRHAMQDPSFGEFLDGAHKPEKWDHVFASIQSAASTDLIGRLGPEYFRHIIVDECHHVPAASYQAVVPQLRPELLVGLTATPERSDGKSLLPDFDNHIAAELRLWHALDDQLLVPFEYYGVSDGVDLRKVRWTRTGYDAGALGDLYTGHTARADLIRHQLAKRVADPRKIRALAFCVSIEHAEFMAARFTAAGIPSRAVFGDSPDREAAPGLLRERVVNVLFTCDLYNEGVDLPFVDTLLLLRPTQSATLFLQQLGRGLRHHTGKSSCLVLDFIGQHRDEFRFDVALSAITGIPRARLRKALEDGFPFLPSGCALQLDAVARDQILASLRSSLAGARRLTTELRELATADTARPTLSRFLEETGRDLDDVYNAGGWTTLQRGAGLIELADSEDADEIEDLSRRLGLIQHVDEPDRLRSYRDVLAAAIAGQSHAWTDHERRRLLMLESQLSHRGVLRAAEQTAQYFAARPTIVRELDELREVLEDRVDLASQVLPVPEWPLALHRHYSRREIAAGVGYVTAGEKVICLQGGILQLKDTKRELLFVTLDKSGKSFSPTTRYRDYAISPELFHWETQAAASVTRPSGRRYIESATTGWTFFLFARPDPDASFAFLGPVTYESHTGDRPIAITWRLATPMPAVLYDRYATLRPG